jgi:hypothetical protein
MHRFIWMHRWIYGWIDDGWFVLCAFGSGYLGSFAIDQTLL